MNASAEWAAAAAISVLAVCTLFAWTAWLKHGRPPFDWESRYYATRDALQEAAAHYEFIVDFDEEYMPSMEFTSRKARKSKMPEPDPRRSDPGVPVRRG